MTKTLRIVCAVALGSLALAPAASAARTQDWTQGNQDPSYQPDPNWNDPTSNDPTSNDPTSNDPSTTVAPAAGTPPTDTTSGTGWTPGQGDPQESPSTNTGSGDPWSNIPPLPVSKTPTVPGQTAMIRRNGLAAVPTGAPAAVRAIITAANQIIGKPYKWGGGHGRLFDSGYDCSGSVSYALIRAGLLGYPMVSGTLAHWGAKGVGRYVAIYANKNHVYMEVAGLRLDTSSVGDPAGRSGVRWRPPIGKRFGFAVRHVAGL